MQELNNRELLISDKNNNKIKVKDLIINSIDMPLIDLVDDNTYHVLLNLKNREYIISNNERDAAFYGLIDCILAYLYDLRVTDFEGNCESHWTIAKLSATLSCFVKYASFKEVFISFSRRSLVFPIHHNFELSLKVIDDLKMLLFIGKKMLLNFVLHIRNIFNANNPKYLLNNIYIDDYCVFVQQLDDKYIKDKLNELMQIKIYYEDLGFPDVEVIDFESDENNIDNEDDDDDDKCNENKNHKSLKIEALN